MTVSRLLAAGVLLLLCGSALAVSAAYRTGTTEYVLEVTAPYGVAWTLWVPRPLIPMAVIVSPFHETPGEIRTFHGSMTVFAGSGPAYLYYRLDSSALRVTPIEPEGVVGLSGGEDPAGYWVFRLSSDGNASIEVAFSGHAEGHQWGDRYSCGGPSFSGSIADGWNLVPAHFGDCVVGLGEPSPPISIAALGTVAASGGVLMVLGVRRVLRKAPSGGA